MYRLLRHKSQTSPNWDTFGRVPPQSKTVHAGNPPHLTDAHRRPSLSMSCCCPFLVNTSGSAANSSRKLVDSMLTTPDLGTKRNEGGEVSNWFLRYHRQRRIFDATAGGYFYPLLPNCPGDSTGKGDELNDGNEEDYAWLAQIGTPDDLYMRSGEYQGPVIKV
ncbi:hypothetical protein RHMOL_Rhmol08G0187600 [Rhododendron molle]|uniref:Uncharacterized protein n=1 Tax=Rhododendron molle TaxID=49168 RepID=A0ACC0MPZ1_RHOML|nr:hypothetical protein RHMOL_Rhmol08G0187600 [Rhododendron molle]